MNVAVGINHPNVGRKLYSPFFKKNIVVTAYTDDNNWMFDFEDGVKFYGISHTPFSYYINNDLEIKE